MCISYMYSLPLNSDVPIKTWITIIGTHSETDWNNRITRVLQIVFLE